MLINWNVCDTVLGFVKKNLREVVIMLTNTYDYNKKIQ